MDHVSISRDKSLIQKIILVNGLWGTGKSMLGPLIGSFNNVEKFMMLELFEHFCNLCTLKKIEHNACINLLKLHADRSLFNSMIGREVNLRINDSSGLLNNPHPFSYLKRLFLDYDSENITQQITVKKPIMNIMVHNFLGMADYAFEAFGEKLKFIEVVRHPIYLVEHWYNYIDRCGTDPTEFDLWIDYKGQSLPWFSYGWEKKYVESKTIDRAIYSLSKLLEIGSLKYNNLNSTQKKNIIFIPFESFVLEPFSYLNRLKLFLETEYDQLLMKKSLKKQKCPRVYIHAEKGRIQYGFNKNHKKLAEKEDYQRRLNFIHEEASEEAVAVIENLSSMYAKDHNFPRKMPWE